MTLDRPSFDCGLRITDCGMWIADCGLRNVDFRDTKYLDRYLNICHKRRFFKRQSASGHLFLIISGLQMG
jgi:hypothetical protein